jgi:folate-binding protein YgfZ
VVAVSGPDAADYLQGQCSQDLADLAPGGAVDSLLLAPDGKVELLVRVARMPDGAFHLDVDAGWRDVLVARLAHFKLRSKLTIETPGWTCVSVRGPEAAAAAGRGAPLVVPFEWHGWGGVDLLGPRDEVTLSASVPVCQDAAWESARIESGVPVMGAEIGHGEIPAETGTVERTVSFTKGCYTGQELVARIDSRGAAVPHRLHGLVLEAEADPVPLAGASLALAEGDRTVGRVTSAAWCPGLGAVGALAYVHRSVPVPGRVQVIAAGQDRTGAPWAQVRTLPLV